MLGLKDNKGISAISIILLGLVVLAVILLDAISININRSAIAKGSEVIPAYCNKNHSKFPTQCNVDAIYRCDDRFILASDCVGVGNVIVNKYGGFIDWCGYTAFGAEEAPSCAQHLLNKRGGECQPTNDLCK